MERILMFEEARPRSEKTWEELQAEVAASAPSAEYKEGKKMLRFEHIFSTGHKMEVLENDEGEVSCLLSKDGTPTIDFSDPEILGNNYKIVSARYLLKNKIDSKKIGEFYTNVPDGNIEGETGFIAVGDMRSPRDIPRIVHEIGHSWVPNISSAKEAIARQDKQEVSAPEYQDTVREEAKLVSYLERSAWAAALKIAKGVKDKDGVNIFEDMGSADDVRRAVALCLSSYRYDVESTAYLNAWKDVWKEQEKGSEQKEPRVEDWDIFGGLFDKKMFSQSGPMEFEIKDMLESENSFESAPPKSVEGDATSLELWEKMAELRTAVHAEMETELRKRLEEDPKPTEEELHSAAFKEWIEPQIRGAVAEMYRKGYATQSSGFYGDHNEIQAVDGYFFVDDETKKKIEALGAEVLDGPALGVPMNKLIRQIRFIPKEAEIKSMKEKWDAIADTLPRQEGPSATCDRVEEFREEFAPDHPSFEKEREEYFAALRKRAGIAED